MKFLIQEILFKPLYNSLILIAWVIPGHSMGWAIIILTIIIRLILLPASLKAAKAQVKMQLLAPKMAEIKEKIKDLSEQGKALNELYKKEGVSPLGSCLPVLIQLPIIWVLYTVFRQGLGSLNLNLLYSFVPHDLVINTSFYGLDITKADPWVLPIIAGLTQFVLSYLTMAKQPVAQTKGSDPMQMMNKQMMYLFPIMTIFIGRSMPSALVIYWIVTTLFGIGQQYYVNKVIKIEKSDLELVEEIESEHSAPSKEVAKPKDKRADLMTKMMNKRLDKQEKKSGVNVIVRNKNNK